MKNKKHVLLIKYIIIAWGYMPYLFIFSLFFFYFHTAILLGKLPEPSINDPKNFSIYNFYEPIIVLSLEVMFYTFGIWIFLSIYFDRKYSFEIIKLHYILIFLGYLFSLLLFCSNILTWFAD